MGTAAVQISKAGKVGVVMDNDIEDILAERLEEQAEEEQRKRRKEYRELAKADPWWARENEAIEATGSEPATPGCYSRIDWWEQYIAILGKYYRPEKPSDQE